MYCRQKEASMSISLRKGSNIADPLVGTLEGFTATIPANLASG